MFRDRDHYPPLVMPAGRKAGINPLHLASANLRFSGIPLGHNMLDLTSGIIGGPSSPDRIVNVMDPIIGYSITGGANNTNIEFLNKPAVTDSACVSAGIFNTLVAGDFSWFSIEAALVGTSYFGLAGGGLLIQSGSNFAVVGSFAANTPYFMAASNNGTTLNWVILNLLTGRLQSGTLAGFALSASSGTYDIGVRGNVIGCNLAASMYAATFLSLIELRAWAADPWAFWYPRR